MPKRDRFEVIDLATPLGGEPRPGFETGAHSSAIGGDERLNNAALRVDRRFLDLDYEGTSGLTAALEEFFFDLLTHQLIPVHRKFASLFIGRQRHLHSLRQQHRGKLTARKSGAGGVAAVEADGPPRLLPLSETMDFLWSVARLIHSSTTNIELLIQSAGSVSELKSEDCQGLISSHDVSITPCFLEAQVVSVDGDESAAPGPDAPMVSSRREQKCIRYRCIPVDSLLGLPAEELQQRLRHCVALACLSASQLRAASGECTSPVTEGHSARQADPQWHRYLHRLVDLSYSVYLDLQESCYDWSRDDLLPLSPPTCATTDEQGRHLTTGKPSFGRGGATGWMHPEVHGVVEEAVNDPSLENRIRIRSKHLLQTFHWPSAVPPLVMSTSKRVECAPHHGPGDANARKRRASSATTAPLVGADDADDDVIVY